MPLYPQERSGSCGLKVLLSHHLVVVGDAVYCLYIVLINVSVGCGSLVILEITALNCYRTIGDIHVFHARVTGEIPACNRGLTILIEIVECVIFAVVQNRTAGYRHVGSSD